MGKVHLKVVTSPIHPWLCCVHTCPFVHKVTHLPEILSHSVAELAFEAESVNQLCLSIGDDSRDQGCADEKSSSRRESRLFEPSQTFPDLH